MGLENIEQLHAGLGRPLDGVPCVVHVAGTNGKGSVCIKVARALEATGVRTGLFVSPHISSFRERMQVNGVPISEAEVERLVPRVFACAGAGEVPATFFEMTTALAFLHFQQAGAQAAVLETGLGGRLDSTNICKPTVSVITSISCDHTKILGDTEEAIAVEKAGIMKSGVPVVIGPMKNRSVLDVLLAVAKEKGAGPVHVVEPSASSVDGVDDFMLDNERVAAATLRALEESHGDIESDPGLAFSALPADILSAALAASPPCRFERVSSHGEEFVLDVAHNPAAMRMLFSRIAQKYAPEALSSMPVVVGMSIDKDLTECLGCLTEWVSAENVFLVQAGHPRAAPVSDMLPLIPGANTCSSVEEGIAKAVERNQQFLASPQSRGADSRPPIIVCGSLYMMDAVRTELGMDVVTDPDVVQQAWSDRKVGLNKGEDEHAKEIAGGGSIA
jgi:dihydrofolate synthase/folylpolyglutamate synthase